ncbi:hypothetical protein OH76DRAFT_462642 [Lentinus brumalis]|uniref:Uncharacterized protein n=1 Tax=Lentinus brumalis TaxID=2498619 RepID=A0A371DCD7_9APHY|nr:hypothetical protein OH76DRAFT_462642 [Polyporus brumalis]
MTYPVSDSPCSYGFLDQAPLYRIFQMPVSRFALTFDSLLKNVFIVLLACGHAATLIGLKARTVTADLRHVACACPEATFLHCSSCKWLERAVPRSSTHQLPRSHSARSVSSTHPPTGAAKTGPPTLLSIQVPAFAACPAWCHSYRATLSARLPARLPRPLGAGSLRPFIGLSETSRRR